MRSVAFSPFSCSSTTPQPSVGERQGTQTTTVMENLQRELKQWLNTGATSQLVLSLTPDQEQQLAVTTTKVPTAPVHMRAFVALMDYLRTLDSGAIFSINRPA